MAWYSNPQPLILIPILLKHRIYFFCLLQRLEINIIGYKEQLFDNDPLPDANIFIHMHLNLSLISYKLTERVKLLYFLVSAQLPCDKEFLKQRNRVAYLKLYYPK